MTDFIKLAEGTELVSKRSENSKTFFAGIVKKDGKDVVKYRQEICIGALHYKDDYKDEKEQYKDIDLTWANNKITTAPYILERIGNKIIVLDKKTGQTGTIELTDIGTSKISTDKIKDVKTKEIVKDVDVEIIPAPDSIRFQTVIKDPTALAQLKYKVSGDIPIKYSAVDADGDTVPLITSLSKGVLTESVDAKSFSSQTTDKTAIKYPIKIDPTLAIQGSGNDTYLDQYYSTTNYGGDIYIELWQLSGYNRRGLFYAGLSSLPAGATIDTATFSLYYYAYNTYAPNGTETLTLYKVRRADWVEAQATWNIFKTSNNWETAGAANTSTDIDTSKTAAVAQPTSYGWTNWDVKTIVEDAVANSVDFNVRLHTSAPSNNSIPRFYTKEYATDTSLRPKLVIEYTTAPDPPTNVAASENDSEKVVVTWTKSEGATNYDVYRNLNITNADFELWSSGDSVAPNGWGLVGTSAAVAKESSIKHGGSYSAKLTRNGTNCRLRSTNLASSAGIANWQGKSVTFRMWVYSTVASRGRVRIYDGVGSTYSSYHTGGSGWEQLTVTRIIDASATCVYVSGELSGGDTSVYFDDADGEVLVAEVGDVDTANDESAAAPVITAGSTVASDGTSSAHVALSLSGTSIANGTSYTYKVKAINDAGSSDFSDTDTGYRLKGTLTYQWQRSSADADFDYEDIDGATTASYNDTDAP
jgi:hypothetical protein